MSSLPQVILGVGGLWHDGNAAVVADGQLDCREPGGTLLPKEA